LRRELQGVKSTIKKAPSLTEIARTSTRPAPPPPTTGLNAGDITSVDILKLKPERPIRGKQKSVDSSKGSTGIVSKIDDHAIEVSLLSKNIVVKSTKAKPDNGNATVSATETTNPVLSKQVQNPESDLNVDGFGDAEAEFKRADQVFQLSNLKSLFLPCKCRTAMAKLVRMSGGLGSMRSIDLSEPTI